MAYTYEIKQAAFDRYCLSANIDSVVQYMHEYFPKACGKLHRNTVLKWKVKLKWSERKEKLESVFIERHAEKIISVRARMLDDAERLRSELVKKLPDVELKSYEGGINALISLSKSIVQLSGNDNAKRLPYQKIIDIIFERLAQHPQIGVLIREYEEFIAADIDKAINAEVAGMNEISLANRNGGVNA
ncbi:MAG: hypothetical protein ACE5I1_21700 [bacterium]